MANPLPSHVVRQRHGFNVCTFVCISLCVKCGLLDSRDKSFAVDTNSPSGPLLPWDEEQKDKDKVHKERKEHREKPNKPYRKYSELTPPTVQSCYDNYGFVHYSIFLSQRRN